MLSASFFVYFQIFEGGLPLLLVDAGVPGQFELKKGANPRPTKSIYPFRDPASKPRIKKRPRTMKTIRVGNAASKDPAICTFHSTM